MLIYIYIKVVFYFRYENLLNGLRLWARLVSFLLEVSLWLEEICTGFGVAQLDCAVFLEDYGCWLRVQGPGQDFGDGVRGF